MEQGRRLYPTAVLHYSAPTLAVGDSSQIRWAGLVVEVSADRILVCSRQDIATGAAVDPMPIPWGWVVPGSAWFTDDGDPIVRPGE